MQPYLIGGKLLTLNSIREIINSGRPVAISESGRENISRCRTWLEEHSGKQSEPVYGVNTGFGSLCNITISDKELNKLQENLIRSHNCGTGDEVPQELVRIMLLLKIHSLAYGYSGVRIETAERLAEFYNRDALPVVYDAGSLGASGDLAPLAAVSMSLIGEGEMRLKGERMDAAVVHKKLNLEPLRPKAKEGLALLNGTQFMGAYAVYVLNLSYDLFFKSHLTGAASLDAFDCKAEPFNALLHNIRNHPGQVLSARCIRNILDDSPVFAGKKEQVQDPYSFRCIPQVHGAAFDALTHAAEVTEREINSVTDNPNVFFRQEEILSGGNFHGQPLALALDYLALAVSELGSISERRTYKLLSGERGLPEFLTENPGLNSGLMIPQYTAASLVSRNKQMCMPASADSIPSSNGQEDHVSMGANGAVKALKIAENTVTVLGIEWLTACQAMHCRNNAKSSSAVESLRASFSKQVPAISEDRNLGPDIEASRKFIRETAPEKFLPDVLAQNR